jgi:hypothetical protein
MATVALLLLLDGICDVADGLHGLPQASPIHRALQSRARTTCSAAIGGQRTGNHARTRRSVFFFIFMASKAFCLEALFYNSECTWRARRNWFHKMFPKGKDGSVTWLSFTVYTSSSRYSSWRRWKLLTDVETPQRPIFHWNPCAQGQQMGSFFVVNRLNGNAATLANKVFFEVYGVSPFLLTMTGKSLISDRLVTLTKQMNEHYQMSTVDQHFAIVNSLNIGF